MKANRERELHRDRLLLTLVSMFTLLFFSFSALADESGDATDIEKLVLLLRHLNGTNVMTGETLTNADADANGVTDGRDALYMLFDLAGMRVGVFDVKIEASKQSAVIGDEVKWTVTRRGGESYLFILLRNGVMIDRTNDFVSSNTYSYKIDGFGEYKVQVYVHDGNGIALSDAQGAVSVINTAPDIEIKSITADKETAFIGETVTWTVEALGGEGGLLYAFEIYKGTESVASRGYDSNASFSYDPTAEGEFTAKVMVKDGTDKYAETTGEITTVSILLFTYERKGDGIAILSYTGNDSHAVVPNYIEGLPVIEINDAAFKRKETLVKVTLPNSVRRIGKEAFSGCIMLDLIDCV